MERVFRAANRVCVAMALAGLALSAGCAEDGSMSTAGVGAALGGLGTFAACKGLANGSTTTCAAVGAAGALVGYGVGRHLQDQRDKQAREAAMQQALAQESARPVRWDNTRRTGARGTITLTRTYTSPAKRRCRSGKESAKLPDGTVYEDNITLCYNSRTARYEPV